MIECLHNTLIEVYVNDVILLKRSVNVNMCALPSSSSFSEDHIIVSHHDDGFITKLKVIIEYTKHTET